MTQQIIALAKPLGIAARDHIILGNQGHESFKDMRLI
jgi:DNA repair protein RadC